MKIIFKSLALLYLTSFTVFAQNTTNASTNAPIFSTGEAYLQNRLDSMETKVDVELESLNKRLDYSHSLFTYFAAFAGCLLTFLTIWSIIRDQRQHRDYRDERKFYEEHVKSLEKTSRERYDKERSAYDELAEAAEKRQSEGFTLAAESLKIANQRESTSAGAQLENIQKLGVFFSW